jgi:hypothetical protein
VMVGEDGSAGALTRLANLEKTVIGEAKFFREFAVGARQNVLEPRVPDHLQREFARRPDRQEVGA